MSWEADTTQETGENQTEKGRGERQRIENSGRNDEMGTVIIVRCWVSRESLYCCNSLWTFGFSPWVRLTQPGEWSREPHVGGVGWGCSGSRQVVRREEWRVV